MSYNPVSADKLKNGGTYTTALAELSPQFNPFHLNSTEMTKQVWRWYNPVLKTYSPDGSKTLWDADYVTHVTSQVKDGKRTVTYTLNPKAQFNDGTPINWRAFEATWKANSGQDSAIQTGSQAGYSSIQSVRAGQDAHEAVVTFKNGYAWWEGLYDFLVHPKAANAKTFNTGYVNTPHSEWGAGPYTIDTIDQKAGTIVFKRNPKWWGNKGKLDRRVMKVMSGTAALNAFRSGQLDSVNAHTAERLSQAKTVPNIDIRRGTSTAFESIALNSQSPRLSDVRVRRAVLQAIDPKTWANISFAGLDYHETVPGSMLLMSYQKGYRNNFPYTFDADASKKALDAAGWKPGADGVRTKDGKRLELAYTLFGDDAVAKATATAVQQMLKNVGVAVRVDSREPNDFSAVLQKRDYDIFPLGFNMSAPYGVANACEAWCTSAAMNLAGLNNPSLDKKFAKLDEIADPDAQTKQANSLEAEAFKQAGTMVLSNGPTIVAAKKGLANVGASGFYQAPPQDIGWQK